MFRACLGFRVRGWWIHSGLGCMTKISGRLRKPVAERVGGSLSKCSCIWVQVQTGGN